MGVVEEGGRGQDGGGGGGGGGGEGGGGGRVSRRGTQNVLLTDLSLKWRDYVECSGHLRGRRRREDLDFYARCTQAQACGAKTWISLTVLVHTHGLSREKGLSGLRRLTIDNSYNCPNLSSFSVSLRIIVYYYGNLKEKRDFFSLPCFLCKNFFVSS